LELHPKSATEYFLKEANVQVSFNRDDNGKTSRLVWHQNGHHIPADKRDSQPPSFDQLSEYEGDYYSDELKVTYGVYVQHDRLCLKAPIVPDVFQSNFRNEGNEDVLRHMVGDQFMRCYGTIRFVRDDKGKIGGFAMNAGPDLQELRFGKL
jgi:hypothetical protein